MKRWWHSEIFQVIASALALALVRYSPFLFGKTIFFGDNYTLLVPGRIWNANWLMEGIFPLWNQLLFSGISWAGDISQSALTLSTLPFMIFQPTTALNLIVVAHFVFTFCGMYLLTRAMSKNHLTSILAAGLWSLSSLWTGAAHNLATLQSMSWFPWALWAGFTLEWKQWPILRLTTIIVGMIAAGYPQHIVATLPVAAILSVANKPVSWKNWFYSWTLTLTLGLGISAPIWMPFTSALLSSTRQLQSAQQAALGSFHPAEFIKVIFPYFFDAPIFGIRWGPNWNFFPTNMPYFSSLGLLILVTSPWKKIWRKPLYRLLLIGTIAGIIISLGSYIPGYIRLLELFPFLTTIRYPSTWLFLPEFFGLCLLSLVAPTWKPPQLLARWGKALLLATMVLGGISLLVWQIWPNQSWNLLNQATLGKLAISQFHTVERDQLIVSLISAGILLNSFLALLAWTLWNRKLIAAAIGILLLDGLLNSQAIILFAPASIYASSDHFDKLPIVEILKNPQYRTLTRNGNKPYTDFGSYWEALVVRPPFSDSFVDSQELQTKSHLIGLRDGLTFDWNIVAGVPIVNGYTTLLPADYQHAWDEVEETRINLLQPIDITDPRLQQWSVKYYLVDHWFSVTEDLSAYPIIYSDDRWSVYELPALTRFRYGDDTPVELIDLRENPNRISFTTDNQSEQSRLIMADRYEPGWKATVNGSPAEVNNEAGRRAISIPDGRSEIVFFYEPWEVVWGLRISGFTLASLIAVILFKLRRNGRK